MNTNTIKESYQRTMWWLACATPEEMAAMPANTRLQYANLGFVFMCNFIFLSAVWIKIGVQYFGWIGVIVPGLLLPATFVLGLDRMIAIKRTRLTGELAIYHVEDAALSSGSMKVLRVLISVALCTFSTFSFMIAMSENEVRQAQDIAAIKMNAPIRAEIQQRINDEFQLAQTAASNRLAQLGRERASIVEQLDRLQSQIESARKSALNAKAASIAELGGLDGKREGAGVKFKAQQELAQLNVTEVLGAQGLVAKYEVYKTDIDAQTAAAHTALATATVKKMTALANLPEALANDVRYLVPRRGVFADATTFVRLYTDPAEANGRWIYTLLAFIVLLSVECACLIAIALNPTSPLDVLRTSNNRRYAADIVAENERAVAQARGRHLSAVRIVPAADAQHQWRGPRNQANTAV